MTDDTRLQDLLRSEDRDPGCGASTDIFDAYIELELAGEDPADDIPRHRDTSTRLPRV